MDQEWVLLLFSLSKNVGFAVKLILGAKKIEPLFLRFADCWVSWPRVAGGG